MAYKRLQLDLNPEPLSSETNTQLFGQTVKSHMSMLNNGPSIEPWGTSDRISCHERYVLDILVLCLQEVR